MTALERCQVLVIGAGPAGCAAALALGHLGLEVLLLERPRPLRTKPCAGGLTPRAAAALGPEVEAVIQRSCHRLVLALGGRHSSSCTPVPVTSMTRRSELDDLCRQRALQAGARMRHSREIQQILGAPGGWEVRLAEGVIRCRQLIGADGAHSRVRRLRGLRPPIGQGLAVEATVCGAGPAARDMELHFGIAPQGYAWIFPRQDHASVGLYTLEPRLPQARHILERFCRDQLGRPPDGDIRGWPIPWGGHAFRHHVGEPLLIGDAAGLADPLLGEGISNAVRSGQLAARAVAELEAGGPDRYGLHIQEITRDLYSYWIEARLFYRHLRWGYRYLSMPGIRHALVKGFALGWPVARIKRQCWQLPFRSYPAAPGG